VGTAHHGKGTKKGGGNFGGKAEEREAPSSEEKLKKGGTPCHRTSKNGKNKNKIKSLRIGRVGGLPRGSGEKTDKKKGLSLTNQKKKIGGEKR